MSARDHPRSRGVYFPRRRRHGRIRGSSPLARGLPRAARSASTSAGIIPARAGFTTVAEGLDMGSEDHPRSRGVYRGDSHSPLGRQGSSPLARGLRDESIAVTHDPRIIPARAGFTRRTVITADDIADHPRSRGVYRCCRPRTRGRAGSSPLARGLRERRVTYAEAIWDHPRSRGVYVTIWGSPTVGRGSSPLARGLRSVQGEALPHVRIIPARAGFTRPRPSRTGHCRDHPRSRGVYGFRRPGRTEMIGSSPLARGLRCDCLGVGVSAGIIPARAGFTRSTLPTLRPRPDHPRSRGVYPRFSHPSFPRSGSSPLARGLHLCSASLLSL